MITRALLPILAVILALFAGPASAFEFFDLRPTVVARACAGQFTRPRGTVRLADEREVVITNWNVESVHERRGGFDAARVDDLGQYADGERRPDSTVERWKFKAKQRKFKDAAGFAGLPPGTLSHFVIAPEVESIAAAEHLFNTGALRGKYRTFLTPGNDVRGVDIAFAVRADLDVDVEVRTHVFAKWWDPTEKVTARLFTRDLPVLVIRDRPSGEVQLVLMGQHAKSMRDRSRGQDKGSVELRSAQLAASAEIVRLYEKEFPDVPIVMAGDFNAEVREAPELAPIKRFMTDAFDVVGARERDTQTYHPKDGVVVASQLDACFVSKIARPFVRRALVLPEFDHRTGVRLGPPTSREERTRRYPSDHRAMATVLDGRLFGRSARRGR